MGWQLPVVGRPIGQRAGSCSSRRLSSLGGTGGRAEPLVFHLADGQGGNGMEYEKKGGGGDGRGGAA